MRTMDVMRTMRTFVFLASGARDAACQISPCKRTRPRPSKSSITTAVAPTIDSRPVTIFLRRVRIAAPMTKMMSGSVASLNVSVASGVCLFESRRRRSIKLG